MSNEIKEQEIIKKAYKLDRQRRFLIIFSLSSMISMLLFFGIVFLIKVVLK